jgi:polysaccharide pyruvyl transferase WcaK-like protein
MGKTRFVTVYCLDEEGSATSAGAAPRGRTKTRVGLFGLLGSGNLGNDASFEVVYNYVRTANPDAIIDAMCMGPELIKARYGIDTIPLQSYRQRAANASRGQALVLKALGKAVDAFRTALWTRRHDVVIVPGMGVLENSLPLRATGTPYALFLLCACGRLFGTKVALVSVGATAIKQRPIRWLFDSAARLAFYRSYRDARSLDVMRQRGICSPEDRVYPDLVFALPFTEECAGAPDTVGVGVMAYYGSNDDRKEAEAINARYLRAMKEFLHWLIDTDHRIRLFWGDDVDEPAVQEIVADLYAYRPDLQPGRLIAERCASLHQLVRAMADVSSVVAIRYHNVLSALKLCKPTIAIAYSAKHEALMEVMSMSKFVLPAQSLEVDQLIAYYTELKHCSSELRCTLRARNSQRTREVEVQFARLSSILSLTDTDEH